MRRRIRRFRAYLRISGVSEISRRYFVMNSFDGIMVMLGIIIGSYVTGAVNPRVVVGAGVGAGVAMGISGFSGAYLTERAERLRRLRKLRKAMLSDLRQSMQDDASKAASLWVAFVDGASPALSALVCMSPFILVLVGLIPIEVAFFTSVGLMMVALFVLGIFLGKVSGGNIVFWGLKMVAVGLAAALVVAFLGGF